MHDLIVVGAGPAGMTAALYALRAGKTVLLLEADAIGGQISKSREVENYPGLPGINGLDLADRMCGQVLDAGADLELERATGVRTEGAEKVVLTESGRAFFCRALILATGLQHRRLGVPGEEELIGKGISFCAVCDGGFFKNREVAVVGGGNTAVQDALYLAQTCSRVYLVHRRESFRAESTLMNRLRTRPNIEILTDTVVTAVSGGRTLSSVTVKNIKTNAARELSVACLFEAVGQIPQNSAFSDLLDLTPDGYINAGEDCLTKTPGVFVAGDSRSKAVRQLTTATADGSAAALAALHYLDA